MCRGTPRGKAKPARFRSVFQGAPPGPLPPSSHVVKEAPNLEPSKASSSGHRGPFARGALQERVRRATNPLQTRAGTGRCVPARSAVPSLICYCWWRCFRLSASSRTTLALLEASVCEGCVYTVRTPFAGDFCSMPNRDARARTVLMRSRIALLGSTPPTLGPWDFFRGQKQAFHAPIVRARAVLADRPHAGAVQRPPRTTHHSQPYRMH